MSEDQLLRDGLAGPYELADKSGLDAVRDAVFELKALRRQQNLAAQKAGAGWREPGRRFPNTAR